jgi:hypothetical protein
MNQITSTAAPGIYTATGAGTIVIVEINGPHSVIACLLREVSDDDDPDLESEWPGGPINELSLTVGEPGILHGASTIGDAELGVIGAITKISVRG